VTITLNHLKYLNVILIFYYIQGGAKKPVHLQNLQYFSYSSKF